MTGVRAEDKLQLASWALTRSNQQAEARVGYLWIHGHVSVHGDRVFLETAERCAGYYLAPDSGVPFWDYGAPNIPEEPLDSSAAAIVASAFWKLKGIEDTERGAKAYRHAALQILATLTSDEFLGTHDPAYEGILRHGVYHRPMNWGVDESVMWGDYLFMEALRMVLAESRDS